MNTELTEAREHFIQGMSRITHFWGFPKAMGAIYGAIYLSPEAVSLDELVELVGISKGSVSTNVRLLERLGMVHRQLQVGDRKDYYLPETDFWKVARNLLKEREQNEFGLALRTVGESLDLVATSEAVDEDIALAAFYEARLQAMKGFFDSLDSLVAMLISLDELRLNALSRFFNTTKKS